MNVNRAPMVSVIVPIYGVEQYLNVCVESIVHQSYMKLEIILVDDGSPDQCPLICDAWAIKDDRIKVIHKVNGGLSDARNTGIDCCTGKYLAFVDSDDYIEPDMINNMLNACLNNDADLACCGRYMVHNDKKTSMHCMQKETIFDRNSAFQEILMGRYMEEAAWDKLYKRELFNDIRYPVGEINEDIVVIPHIIDRCNKIVHVGMPLYNYRSTANSITTSSYSEKKSVYLKHIENLSNYIERYYPSLENSKKHFVVRYSYAMLLDMAMNVDTLNKFKEDYKQYLKLFRKTYLYMIKSKDFRLKSKIQGLLIILRIYSPLIRLKKKINH